MTVTYQRVFQKRGIIAAAAAVSILLPAAVIRAQGTSAARQEMPMTELLSGKTIPLQLQMKDLAMGQWRHVTAVGKTVSPASVGAPSALGERPTYTKGETVRIDGESFLVLYTLQSLGTKDAITAQNLFGGRPTPDGALALTLLSLRNTDALASLTAFDLSKETITQAEIDRALVKIRNDNTDAALREIGKGMQTYYVDYEGKMPPMNSSESAKAALGPYVRSNKSEYFFTSATSRKSFLVNPTLSRKQRTSIANPERTVAVYDGAPTPDGTRAATFADGHVERFPEMQWPEIARASGISVR